MPANTPENMRAATPGSKRTTARRRWPWVALAVLCAAVMAVSGTMLLKHYLPDPNRHIVPEPSADPSSAAPVLVDNPIDFAALQAENSDIVGWIRIPGTTIDYPILQSSEEEEEDFYLSHDSQKQPKRAGSIYIQKLNSASFTDANTLLYGHYMANGSMFADLHQFRKEAFFNEHQTAYIYTPGHILTYTIYSAFVYDDRHILNSFDFHSVEGYQTFIDETLNPPSMARRVREGVSVTTSDRIISMSTCVGAGKQDQRYLVEGVLTRDELTN